MSKRRDEDQLPKPTLFIGSSVEGLPLAVAAQSELNRTAQVVRWDQGTFSTGWNTLSSLIKIGQAFDFAMLIATGDDVTRSRGRQGAAVRDNVLFEFGLFIGLLGIDRVFYVYDDDAKPRIPTDLLGQNHLSFRRLTNSLIHADLERAALGPACAEIRKAIEKKGVRFHWLDSDKPITEELPPEVLSLRLMEHNDPRHAKTLKPDAIKVLMIEDYFAGASSLARLFYMFDFHVINCYDGKVGLDVAIATQPDVVLIDQGLPTMNGLEVCVMLKKNEITKHIPVIMFSGYSSASEEAAALSAGVDDFLGKPADMRVLIERIKKQLKPRGL